MKYLLTLCLMMACAPAGAECRILTSIPPQTVCNEEAAERQEMAFSTVAIHNCPCIQNGIIYFPPIHGGGGDGPEPYWLSHGTWTTTLQEFIDSGKFCEFRGKHEWGKVKEFTDDSCNGQHIPYGIAWNSDAYRCAICHRCRRKIKKLKETEEWEP